MDSETTGLSQTSGSDELASRGVRLGASLLDGVIAMVPYIFVVMGENNKFLGVLGFIGLLGLLGYQIFLLTTLGQTIGKKILGIRIVKLETGDNGGFVTNVVLRGIVNGLLGLVPLYALVDVCFIFRQDKRCIHDLIAKTRVIKA